MKKFLAMMFLLSGFVSVEAGRYKVKVQGGSPVVEETSALDKALRFADPVFDHSMSTAAAEEVMLKGGTKLDAIKATAKDAAARIGARAGDLLSAQEIQALENKLIAEGERNLNSGKDLWYVFRNMQDAGLEELENLGLDRVSSIADRAREITSSIKKAAANDVISAAGTLENKAGSLLGAKEALIGAGLVGAGALLKTAYDKWGGSSTVQEESTKQEAA